MSKAVILIVEDDPLQRQLIKEHLEQEDYAVFDVSSGKQALELLERYPVDVAVVDYRLEKETGVEVIQEILKQNPLVTPVIITAFANIETAVEAMRKGAYDYIVKPIDVEKFLLSIERALERQKLRREISLLKSSRRRKI